jgi:predicted adenylyl cyclase CyaB
MPLNFEFKARSSNNKSLEQALQSFHPRFIGEDHQTDTYFLVPFGRLKLREGNIENALIHYQRSNIAGAKQSDVLLYQHQPDKALKNILTNALGIKTVVVKSRRIWFVEYVKFHFDHVAALGDFIEVEAIDTDGSKTVQQLQEQCSFYASLFQIAPEHYVAESYSDLLLATSTRNEHEGRNI